jgi:predicted secreted protein
MSITAAIVLFAIIWWMVFFMVLPIRVQSQGEAQSVLPGTPPGAPARPVVGRKARLTTLIALVVWAVIAGIIVSDIITIRDLDFMGRMDPLPTAQP